MWLKSAAGWLKPGVVIRVGDLKGTKRPRMLWCSKGAAPTGQVPRAKASFTTDCDMRALNINSHKGDGREFGAERAPAMGG